jgi:mannonate dehydratase
MATVIEALVDVGYSGPLRPDHGRMIWGETGRTGYGLHDRALAVMYLYGLWQGIRRQKGLNS